MDSMAPIHTPCFAADAALGRLVKWLRIAGFDTVYDSRLTHAKARCFIEAGRTLLTRKLALFNKLSEERVIFIKSDNYLQQIQEVVKAQGLGPEHLSPFSRCTKCNLLTASVDRSDVFGKVPDYIWENTRNFRFCNGCQRIYWRGSHADKVSVVLACFEK